MIPLFPSAALFLLSLSGLDAARADSMLGRTHAEGSATASEPTLSPELAEAGYGAWTSGDERLKAGRLHEAIADYLRSLEAYNLVERSDTRHLSIVRVRIQLATAYYRLYLRERKLNDLHAAAEQLAAIADDPAAKADGWQLPQAEADAERDLRLKIEALLEARQEIGPPPPPARGKTDARADSASTPANRRMVVAGAALTGAAGGLTIACITSIVFNVRSRTRLAGEDSPSWDDAWTQARDWTRASSITTGLLAGATLATGVALIVVGKRGGKRDSVAAGGLPLHRGAGAAVSGRF